MKCVTGLSRAARRISFTLGTVLALCLMAFASMGGVASAHTLPHHNVLVNVQHCNQVAYSKAKHHAFTITKQTQVCIFVQKLTLDLEHWYGKDYNSHASHVLINVQHCNQVAYSKAKHHAFTVTKQEQLCIFAQNIKVER